MSVTRSTPADSSGTTPASLATVASSTLGPSFPCPEPGRPLAELVCSSPLLARDDLRLVEAYQALRYRLDEAGKDALTEEAIAFTAAVHRRCRIPPAGSALAAAPTAIPCVHRYYEAERDLWVSRLSGAAAEEAAAPLAEHIVLQGDLQALGFLAVNASIDGVYGPATRRAIRSWQGSQGRVTTGYLSNGDAHSLIAEADARRLGRVGRDTAASHDRPILPAASLTSPLQASENHGNAGPPGVDEVPLEQENGISVVPIGINGVITLDFVVDSGAAEVQIPADVFLTLVRANTIGVSDMIGDRTYVLANGSSQREPRFVIRELTIGGRTFHDVAASVGPASGMLLLGQSFLQRFAQWTLDNREHVLRLVEKPAGPHH